MKLGDPVRILVLDDDVELAAVVGRALERLGFMACVVSTTADAFGQLERQPFDVVLSDWDLGRDHRGDAFLMVVKERAPSVLRIIYSGRRLTDTSCADAVLEKPCSGEDIKNVVVRLLSGPAGRN